MNDSYHQMINCLSEALGDTSYMYYLLNNTFKWVQGELAVSVEQTVQV